MISDTKEVIFEKNSKEKMPMASTTKIMTAILALEKTNPRDVVTVSANAERQEGSSIYLERGDKIAMEDLLYGLMLNSGNDAAVAVAEFVSGSVDEFAREMTRFARKIGAKDTYFKNPNGLDADGHYTTAYDLALITSYAMDNEVFRRIVSTVEKSGKVNDSDIVYFRNHNKLLKMYDGAIGVKTGYTKRCGRCLVSAAERDGIELIGVTLNAPDDWNDHMNMMDYGFSGCKRVELANNGEPFKTLYTTQKQELGCVLGEGAEIIVFGEKVPESEVIVNLPKTIKAPLKKGEKIGEAEILVEGKSYKKTDILCDRDIFDLEEKPRIYDSFLRVVRLLKKIYLQ